MYWSWSASDGHRDKLVEQEKNQRAGTTKIKIPAQPRTEMKSNQIAFLNENNEIIFRAMEVDEQYYQLYGNWFFNFRGFVAGIVCGFCSGDKDVRDHARYTIYASEYYYENGEVGGCSLM